MAATKSKKNTKKDNKAIVSTYSADLGRGVIVPEDESEDEPGWYLIDFRQISPGVGALRAGQEVTYDRVGESVMNVAPIW